MMKNKQKITGGLLKEVTIFASKRYYFKLLRVIYNL